MFREPSTTSSNLDSLNIDSGNPAVLLYGLGICGHNSEEKIMARTTKSQTAKTQTKKLDVFGKSDYVPENQISEAAK